MYPSDHSFFTTKYEILQLNPNGHSFFYSEIQNSTVTTIRFSQRNTKFKILPFVLWLQNTKFWKLFRNGHLLFANKLKNLKLHPNCHSFFWPRNTKSEAVLKRPFVFWLQTTKIELFFQLYFKNLKKFGKSIS